MPRIILFLPALKFCQLFCICKMNVLRPWGDGGSPILHMAPELDPLAESHMPRGRHMYNIQENTAQWSTFRSIILNTRFFVKAILYSWAPILNTVVFLGATCSFLADVLMRREQYNQITWTTSSAVHSISCSFFNVNRKHSSPFPNL